MSTIPMMDPVSKDTVDHYALNNGSLGANFDFEGITDAESFVAYVRANPDKLFGVTTGATDINENRESWEPERNGKRVPAVGEQYFAGAKPSIKATLLEINDKNVKIASGAADVEGEGTNFVRYKPRAVIKKDDHLKNVVWFTNYADKGILVTILHNALCTKGLHWSANDKKVVTSEVEFIGHAETLLFDDTLPIEYGVLYNQASAAGE